MIALPTGSVVGTEEESNDCSASTVVGIRRTSNQLSVVLSDGRNLSLNPFTYVKVGNRLVEQHRDGTLAAIDKVVNFAPTGFPKSVRIHPTYSCEETVVLPPHTLKVTFRERENTSDWNAARVLEQFHYRGKGLNRLVGRRTVLLLDADDIGVIGYGVLSATVAAAKPRFALLDTNFADQMNSKLINKIARIPRVVVHPEFRGLGLGARLAAHLVEYAKTRWDINGYKPIMVEVIASMTDYHGFFQVCGFLDAGQTVGLEKGILPQYGNGVWEERPNVANYQLFRGQGPKPYLVYPLTNEVAKALEGQGIQRRERRLTRLAAKLRNRIQFSNVSVAYKSNNWSTERASEVRQVFDVDGQQISSEIFGRFSLTINPGEVILITGASGSGKSTLIKLLTQPHALLREQMEITGEAPFIDPEKVAVLSQEWDNSLPLVDQVGSSAKEAISLLNGVGLAEAHLYLKRPSDISEGQRYRFALARLCDTSRPLWIGDEFASSLDARTAATVARGLRRAAANKGATVVLAAPHIDHFVGSLAPNKIVRLRWGAGAEVSGAKLRYRPSSDGPSVWVHNTGRVTLTRVIVQLLSLDGTIASLSEQQELKPSKRSVVSRVPRQAIGRGSSILVTTNEGPGDVIYCRT